MGKNIQNMEEFDVATIARRSIHGAVALVSRTFAIQIISLVSSFLLTIFLEPNAFGIFFVISSVIAFLAYFSDIGLAAALIQKKEAITQDDLKTTFTIQQMLIGTLVVIALLASDAVGSFYNLESAGILLFQALVISFFMSSLKTIPSIILERDLRFDKLVIPQIAEALVFNVVAVTLALLGFGISSFTYAVLGRGVTGLVVIYIIQPWRATFGFSRQSAKRLLSYGMPFQANSVLALLKDELIPVYIGKVLPLTEVGYIGFAKKWALTPLRLIMDNVIRITFPSFSRLQSEKKLLSLGIEKSLFVGTAIIFPSLVMLVVLSPYLIDVIPRYEKWRPALLSLSLFSIDAFLSSISTPLTNALNAIGKIKITLTFMIFWTVATWILTPLAIILYGFNGVALVSALIATSVVAVIYISKRYIEFDVIKAVSKPFFASAIMGVVLYFVTSHIVLNIFTLLVIIFLAGVLYISLLYYLAKKEVRADIYFALKQFKKGSQF